jgi:hypothetical protein
LADRIIYNPILIDAMNDHLKYDPEDIESLLMHKQYNELFEEERQFVLQHVGGEEEYESLRKTLFELHDSLQRENWLEPDPSIKSALLAEFSSEKKAGFKVWLNHLFATINFDWFRRPAFAISFATACIAVAIFFIVTNKQEVQHAANNVPVETSASVVASEDSTVESARLFAENLTANALPPTPAAAMVPTMEKTMAIEESDMGMAEDNSMLYDSKVPADDYSEDQSQDYVTPGQNKNDAVQTQVSEQKSASGGLQNNSVDDASVTQPATTSAGTKRIESIQQTQIKSVVTLSDENELEHNTFHSQTVGTASGSQLFFTDPAVAPASKVRDVFELLFTAK